MIVGASFGSCIIFWDKYAWDKYATFFMHKKRLSSQTANLFVNLKSNTMKNTLQIYGHLLKIQVLESNQCVL